MDIGNLDFNSITGIKDLDQARALRLILAVIEDDLLQLSSVAEEVHTDIRSEEIALWELIIGLSSTVANLWISSTDKETAITGIQQALLPTEGDSDE